MEETIDRYPVPGNPDFHLGQVEENVTLSRTYPALSNLPNNRPNLPDRKQAQTRRFHILSLCLYIYRERERPFRSCHCLPLWKEERGWISAESAEILSFPPIVWFIAQLVRKQGPRPPILNGRQHIRATLIRLEIGHKSKLEIGLIACDSLDLRDPLLFLFYFCPASSFPLPFPSYAWHVITPRGCASFLRILRFLRLHGLEDRGEITLTCTSRSSLK